MREITGDLWMIPACARVIPTNSVWTMVKGHPMAVMGAGLALQAKQRAPDLPGRIAQDLQHGGVQVRAYVTFTDMIIAFPTKGDWRHPADLALIARSTEQLVTLVDAHPWMDVLVPRVGCGLGQREWAEVQPILAARLDDRFIVVTPPARKEIHV